MPERRILVAVTGGIAAYKVPELVRALRRAGHAVRCVMTPEATRFVAPLVLQTLSGERVRANLLDPAEEGEIDHIALADWAELVVWAPATAHSLAKLAQGLADDLPSAIGLATRAPLLLAPAMNVNMWRHPATAANAATLGSRGAHFVGPEAGELACGWEGEGRMSEPAAIAAAAERLLGPGSLAGEVVLVTAGGTREAIDAVRYLGNRSSGKMGFAVAEEAARRGAEVVLVAGSTALATPAGVRRPDLGSALEMRDDRREGRRGGRLPPRRAGRRQAPQGGPAGGRGDHARARAQPGHPRRGVPPQGLARRGRLRRRERRPGGERAPQARPQGLRPP